MTSRTPEGKHTKRFIVLVKGVYGTYHRSGNVVINGFFDTKEEAREYINETLSPRRQPRIVKA